MHPLLSPPEASTLVETDVGRAWYVDGITILQVSVSHADAAVTDQHDRMAIEARPDGDPGYVLADIRRVRWASVSGRDRSIDGHVAAVAMLVDNAVSRMVGSFFVTLSNPPYPARVFSEVDAAVAWLQSQMGNE